MLLDIRTPSIKIIVIYYRRQLKVVTTKAQTGDKVRLKANGQRGPRGLIEKVRGCRLMVRLDDSEKSVEVTGREITNFSLAARKAWVTMPKRRVGRPKGMKFCDRVSVTLRIDRELWEQFRQMESSEIIDDRTATINGWLREKLAELENGERQG